MPKITASWLLANEACHAEMKKFGNVFGPGAEVEINMDNALVAIYADIDINWLGYLVYPNIEIRMKEAYGIDLISHIFQYDGETLTIDLAGTDEVIAGGKAMDALNGYLEMIKEAMNAESNG